MSIASHVLGAIVLLVIFFTMKAVVIISQSETKVIERLGKYYATLQPGINIIMPFLDHAKEVVAVKGGRYVYTSTIDLREQVYDFARQNVITKDNIQMQINALLYFQIVDPFKAVYEINNLPNAIEKLTQTTLRDIIGEMELDQTLTSRDTINTKLRAVLDDATNKWGIKVNRVELQDITPPESVLQAMEKQMQAERNKRATILTSEGEKQAAILQSEGEKASTINRAEADKQQAILIAEGEAGTHPQGRSRGHCHQQDHRGRRQEHQPRQLPHRPEVHTDALRDGAEQQPEDRLYALRGHQPHGIHRRHQRDVQVKLLAAAYSATMFPYLTHDVFILDRRAEKPPLFRLFFLCFATELLILQPSTIS